MGSRRPTRYRADRLLAGLVALAIVALTLIVVARHQDPVIAGVVGSVLDVVVLIIFHGYVKFSLESEDLTMKGEGRSADEFDGGENDSDDEEAYLVADQGDSSVDESATGENDSSGDKGADRTVADGRGGSRFDGNGTGRRVA